MIAQSATQALAHAGVVDSVHVGTFNGGFVYQDFPSALIFNAIPELRYTSTVRCENACATGSAAIYSARDAKRALVFRSTTQVSDFLPLSRRDPTEFSGARRAWQRGLDDAKLTLDDLAFVETQDCFMIAELLEYDAMGLAEKGQGARVILDGVSTKEGRLPINPSGGLKSKGHPIGATGVSMHVMAAMQLAGEAGDMQIPNANVAGVFNHGRRSGGEISEHSRTTRLRRPTRMLTTVMNLGDLLTQAARRLPDEPGFITPSRTHTWAEIDRRVDAVCAALRAQDIGKGDRILVHSRNNLPLFESAWIAFKLGAMWVPTNYRVAPPETAYLAKSSGARVMIYDRGFANYVDAVRDASDALEFVIALDAPRACELDYEALASSSEAPFASVDVDRDDPLWFFYTSGTPGHPKAGTLTHGQMAFVVTSHLADLMPGITYKSRSLVVAPLSHGAGIHAIVNTARGAAHVLPASDKMDPEEVWSLVQQHRVDNMFTVPTIVKMLTEHESVDRFTITARSGS